MSVKERPTGSFSLGFGYSSVDKLIGTASIAQSNFMGTGLKLDLSGTVSASSSRYMLGVTEPWLFDRRISAGIDIYNTEKQYPDFDIRKKGFDVRFGFPITKRYTRGNITYKLEDAYISNVDAGASTFIKQGCESSGKKSAIAASPCASQAASKRSTTALSVNQDASSICAVPGRCGSTIGQFLTRPWAATK